MTEQADSKLSADGPKTRPQRLYPAVIVSALVVCAVVSIAGAGLALSLQHLEVSGPSFVTGLGNENSIFSGVYFAAELAAYSYILFFVTVPLASLAMLLSRKRTANERAARTQTMLVPAAMNCGVLFASLPALISIRYELHTIIASIITGGLIGAVAGASGALIFGMVIGSPRAPHE